MSVYTKNIVSRVIFTLVMMCGCFGVGVVLAKDSLTTLDQSCTSLENQYKAKHSTLSDLLKREELDKVEFELLGHCLQKLLVDNKSLLQESVAREEMAQQQVKAVTTNSLSNLSSSKTIIENTKKAAATDEQSKSLDAQITLEQLQNTEQTQASETVKHLWSQADRLSSKVSDSILQDEKLVSYNGSSLNSWLNAVLCILDVNGGTECRSSSAFAGRGLSGAEIADGAFLGEQFNLYSIQTAALADDLYVNGYLLDSSITSEKISDGVITFDHIDPTLYGTLKATYDSDGFISTVATGTVTSEQFADSAIQASNILDNSLSATLLADDSITGEKINSITGLTGLNVVQGIIAAEHLSASLIPLFSGSYVTGGITSRHFDAGSITEAKLATGAIDSTKIFGDVFSELALSPELRELEATATGVLPSTIMSVHIQTNSVSSIHLADMTVQAIDFATGSVMSHHISPSQVISNHIGNNQILATHIVDAAITSSHLQNDIDITDGYITVISEDDIASSVVTSQVLASNSVVSASLQAGSVGSVQLASGTVLSTDIALATLRMEDFEDGVFSAANLTTGDVTARVLGPNSIESSNIASNSITEQKIQNGAITSRVIADGTLLAVKTALSTSIENSYTVTGTVSSSFSGISSALSGSVAAQCSDCQGVAASYSNGVLTLNYRRNEVNSALITDGTVGGEDLSYLSIFSQDIAVGAVTGNHIANGSIEYFHFSESMRSLLDSSAAANSGSAANSGAATSLDGAAIAFPHIQENSVNSLHIADGAVSVDDVDIAIASAVSKVTSLSNTGSAAIAEIANVQQSEQVLIGSRSVALTDADKTSIAAASSAFSSGNLAGVNNALSNVSAELNAYVNAVLNSGSFAQSEIGSRTDQATATNYSSSSLHAKTNYLYASSNSLATRSVQLTTSLQAVIAENELLERGVVVSAALAGGYVERAGKASLKFSFASYSGHNALGITFVARINTNWQMNVSFASDSKGDGAVGNLRVGYQW